MAGEAAGDTVLQALAGACPAARAAGGGDSVAGVTPRYAASPASVAEASAVMRVAAEQNLAVVARGSGSRLDWGAPPRRCDLVVDTLRLDQVVEHAAGDLVARVQAGVGLRQLGQVLAAAGQQLALDVAPAAGGGQPAPTGTVGGTLATGTAGPRRLRYGTPRDLVIGITVVRADGTVASSGGKVVKNVAGYDLGKLFTGSYGTLGLIVEAVFRLHPLPATAAYTTVDAAGPADAYRAAAAAAASELAPTAVEISRAGRDHPVRVGVLLEGDPAGVGERAAHLRELLGGGAVTSPGVPGWWGRTEPPGGPGTLIRIAFWAAALPAVLSVVDGAAAAGGLDPLVAGSAAAGVIYVALGAGADPAAVAAFIAALREAIARGEADARPEPAPVPDSPPVLASAVVVHAPPAVREQVDLWGPVPGLTLMRAVKDQFDPGHRMAPGRFVGGI
ncbi:MAG TPA: FAD-binding oxidoreductase [Streptosporangiaceae bacterium]|nr:FAD-binding oxidoreductase [Streptosporangiaceae bacterium]